MKIVIYNFDLEKIVFVTTLTLLTIHKNTDRSAVQFKSNLNPNYFGLKWKNIVFHHKKCLIQTT